MSMIERLTQAELARRLGIGPSMVTKLKARGMPTESVEAARTWRDQQLQPARRKGVRAAAPRDQQPGRRSVAHRLLVEKLRREAAEALIAERRAAEQAKRLVSANEVRLHYGQHLVAARETLLNLASRLTPLLVNKIDPAQVHQLLVVEVHRALAHLSGADAARATDES
jgi:transcriptional regulator with XRE-family HTH domain